MKKAELRKLYLEKRKALSKDEVASLSEKIFENFISKLQLVENQKVHIFLSIYKFNEVNTKIFIDYFFEHQIRVFVPKMINGKIISLELTKDTKLVVNSWGIAEPEGIIDSGIIDFDYIITPLLYCDASGNRVGYGKGFYDSFFSTISPQTLKVGVSFFPPEEKISDIISSDIPLDYLVTPIEVLSFGAFASNFIK